MKCEGTSQRTGEPCKKAAMNGRRHCRTHARGQAIGPAHPNFKHGRFSRYQAIANKQLAEKYLEAINDPELTQHRHSIAVLEARADELLESGESELLWGKAQAAFQRLNTSIKNKGDDEMRAALSELSDLLTRGHKDALRWAEYYRVTEQAERTKERENKRLVAMEQMMSVEYLMEQLLAFVGIVVDVAKETIKDRAVLREFVSRLNAVTPRPGAEGNHKPDDSTDLSDNDAAPPGVSLIGLRRYRGE